MQNHYIVLYHHRDELIAFITARTAKFHAFLKDALTKNAKRRPTADKLLFHPFVAQFLVADTLKSLIQGTQAQVSKSIVKIWGDVGNKDFLEKVS